MALPVLLFCVALLASPDATGQDELEPPEISWRKGPRSLKVRVVPAEGSHLNSALPLLLTLDDGSYFTVRWTEPLGPDPVEGLVRLPRVAGPDSDGWTLEVSGGVCNDDASICLAWHAAAEIPLRGARGGRLVASPGPPPRTAPEAPEPPTTTTVDRPPPSSLHPGAAWLKAGHDGGVEAAFAAAQSSGRNLLIDFHAQWCPPCDRLRDEFLTDPRRFPLLAGFVLLSADADDPATFDLKDRHHVGGYPTVLVLDPQGRELDRVLGYDGQADRLATRLEGLREATGWDEPPAAAAPIERLRRLVAADRLDEAAELVQEMDPPAREAFAGDYDALSLVLAAVLGRSPEAAAGLAVDLADSAPTPGLTAAHAEAAAQTLEELGRADEAAALRMVFAERLDAVLGSRTPVEVVLSADEASLEVSAPFQSPESLDDRATAAWYRAKWAEPEAARALRVEGAGALAIAIVLDRASHAPLIHRPPAEVRIALSLPTDLVDADDARTLSDNPGRVHDLVDLLDAAGLPDVSEPLYRAMTDRFPDAFTWHYALAGFLMDHRAGEGAIAAARAAWENSYGDNRLRAAKRLAERLHAVGEHQEALSVVEEALAVPPPDQEDVRTHRYRAALEALRDGWLAVEPR
jgi:thiol-disulfide isomerase/thioredoxin